MLVERLKRVVLDRLIRYYRYLAEFTATHPVDTITSARIGTGPRRGRAKGLKAP